MKRILTLATFSLIAFSVNGQTTTTGPTTAQIVADRVARLTVLLTLTSAQQTQATTIFTAEETALTAIRTSIQTAQTALETAVQKNDGAAIAADSAQIGSLVGQEVGDEAKADAAFYLTLTSAQQTQYNNLKLFGIDGLGGPGGPGGGPRH